MSCKYKYLILLFILIMNLFHLGINLFFFHWIIFSQSFDKFSALICNVTDISAAVQTQRLKSPKINKFLGIHNAFAFKISIKSFTNGIPWRSSLKSLAFVIYYNNDFVLNFMNWGKSKFLKYFFYLNHCKGYQRNQSSLKSLFVLTMLIGVDP